MKSVSLESYNITKKVRKGDLARMLDMELEFIEFNYPYIVSTTSKLETMNLNIKFKTMSPIYHFFNKKAIKKYKIMIVSDSFGEIILPYFQDSFENTIQVPRNLFSKKIIEKYKPDIVVNLSIERYLFL